MSTELALQEAITITERIRANGQIAVNAVCAIGKDLRTMKIQGLYTHIGYENFEDYAEKEFSLKRRQAYQYISVYENLGEEFVQSNAQLGITKLALLTQIDTADRRQVMEDNDLEGMTVNEVRELIDKMKQQGEQLSMFESENITLKDKLVAQNKESIRVAEQRGKLIAQRDDYEAEVRKLREELELKEAKLKEKDKDIISLESTIEQLESRPVDVAVAEPVVKEVEVIKEVPDEKAIAEKEQEISALKEKYRELEEQKKRELDSAKEAYEAELGKLKKSTEQAKQGSDDIRSFKLLYADAYKSFSGVVEFVKDTDEPDRTSYLEKVERLIAVIKTDIDDISEG